MSILLSLEIEDEREADDGSEWRSRKVRDRNWKSSDQTKLIGFCAEPCAAKHKARRKNPICNTFSLRIIPFQTGLEKVGDDEMILSFPVYFSIVFAV